MDMDDIVPIKCYENLKRYWKRRNYQKTCYDSNHNNRRKLKIIRLGDHPGSSSLQGLFWPIKFLAKFHDAYLDLMIRLAGNVARESTGAGAFAGKKVAKTKQFPVVSCGEVLVDSKLVLEIYKRLGASRQ